MGIFNFKPLAASRCYWDRVNTRKGRQALLRKTWGCLPQVNRNFNERATGNPDYHWMAYVRDKYFPGGDMGDTLSLGCAEGIIERELAAGCGCRYRSLLGIDLSEKCIQAAQKLGEAAHLAPRLQYQVQDLNHYLPPENSFDTILFHHSLHHVQALEQLLPACARALKPGGRLIANEYVGPARFQWTDLQLAAANAVFKLLPKSLRYDPALKGPRPAVMRPPREAIISLDETEAVRSDEAEGILKQHFDMLEEFNFGGTLINLVFGDLTENYDPDNPWHDAVIRLMIHHENTLIANGLLPSDFKCYVARPKSKGRARQTKRS